MDGPAPRATRSPGMAPTRVIDLALVLYGLVTGILAVAAGVLATPSLARPTVIIVAVVASLLGNSLLRWLLPRSRSSSPVRYS